MALFLVFPALMGCCGAVIFLELLIKEDPGCGHLVTFSTFLFLSIEGFINATDCGRKNLKVPVSEWFKLVTFFFVVNVINNWTFSFNISMPYYMIFKSGSLVASLLTEKWVLKRSHSTSKHVAVILITAGIGMCTLASSKDSSNGPKNSFKELVIGVFLLSASLILSARMGAFNEQIYAKWGRHPQEAMFFSHCLPLPFFMILGPNIKKHFVIAVTSTPMIIPFVNLEIPCMLVYWLGNLISQYVCSYTIFRVTSYYSCLTTTLILTLRKLLSILFSIWYFDNPFTSMHWLGSALVFLGTLIFSNVHQGIMKQKQN